MFHVEHRGQQPLRLARSCGSARGGHVKRGESSWRNPWNPQCLIKVFRARRRQPLNRLIGQTRHGTEIKIASQDDRRIALHRGPFAPLPFNIWRIEVIRPALVGFGPSRPLSLSKMRFNSGTPELRYAASRERLFPRTTSDLRSGGKRGLARAPTSVYPSIAVHGAVSRDDVLRFNDWGKSCLLKPAHPVSPF